MGHMIYILFTRQQACGSTVCIDWTVARGGIWNLYHFSSLVIQESQFTRPNGAQHKSIVFAPPCGET